MKRILWFRRDLRVTDNKILSYTGEVLPIFIFDKNILNHLQKDDKRVSLIYFYVMKLKKELQKIGLDLKIFYDVPENVFDKLLQEYDFDEVVASGDYDAYARKRDIEISRKIDFHYLNETYLFKPKEILKKDATPYLVFTPFFKECMKRLDSKVHEKVQRADMQLLHAEYEAVPELENMGFEYQKTEVLSPYEKLEIFQKKIGQYKEKRDFLNSDVTSHLSVDLRFGTIGVREVVNIIGIRQESYELIRELIFREFYAYLLFHFPSVETQNFKYAFNGVYNKEKYERFITAKTGVPIVDAGVRELLTTGNMHNRIRMIAASFFTKDLLLPWQLGEAFFAKYLLDYDKASNALSWQWSAGTGIDPQPYFRVFNPYLQSKKFDAEAEYIKRYLPQLKDIPSKQLHDENYLLNTDIPDYVKPIVEHEVAAKIAIEVFKN